MNRLIVHQRLAPAFRGLTAIAALMLVAGLGLSHPARAATGLLSQMTTITETPPVAYNNFGSTTLVHSGTVVSADGQTALVVAPFASVGSSGAGKAYIYHYANGQWTQTAELDDPDAAAGNLDFFGCQGALSANGTVAIIGAFFATVNGQSAAGKAYVYTLTNGTWTLSHTFTDPAATSGDLFGFSVGLSGDGSTAAINALLPSTNGQGEAYIYHKANGSWSQAAAIPDPDNTNGDFFGYSLAVSGDGNSVLIGSGTAVNNQSAAGKAYLYTLSNGSWMQTHEFDDPAATSNDNFGLSSVSLSANGQSAAISALGTTVNGQSNAGTVYMYQATNGVWNQTAAIADPDAGAGDQFGVPAQISGDGTRVLIGSLAPTSGTYAGAGKAYLYTQSNGSWSQTKAFNDPAATTGDYFGASGVALSGDGQTAVISAGLTTVNGVSQAGAAYIYQSPADLSLALSPRSASVEQYENVALDATVYNTDSTVTANNVVLSFTLPAGLSYIAGNAGNGSCSASGQTATCTLASLAPGAVWQPTVRATALKTGMLSSSATVTSNSPDPATSNNAASATVTVTPYTTNTHKGSSGGGASTPLGLLALAALLGLAGLRRQVLKPNR